ncbi:hypothetical protein BC361_19410 [Ensifer sp. LC54]|nr:MULTISPECIES: Tn3 family transposase [unclassified Ensifer]OCP24777.1 hypothetical protein BC361_19410 [Ensifer sp. LC54]OCP25884.1 hypothetical protein BC363_19125 [Ensifer sp. LC384]
MPSGNGGSLERAATVARPRSFRNVCIAGLDLLTAIIIYWNTRKLGEIVAEQIASGEQIDLGLLPHVSPLGWEHITLTGEYRWPPLR